MSITNSDDDTPKPLNEDERRSLRTGVDVGLLEQLVLLLDPTDRRFVLNLCRRSVSHDEMIQAARECIGPAAADKMQAEGPLAWWIEFPDEQRNRLFRQVVGAPAV
jgi:hypothetical protein